MTFDKEKSEKLKDLIKFFDLNIYKNNVIVVKKKNLLYYKNMSRTKSMKKLA